MCISKFQVREHTLCKTSQKLIVNFKCLVEERNQFC